MHINISRIPAEEGCPGFVLRRPEGFAPMGFGAGFLWAPGSADLCFDLWGLFSGLPGIFRVFFICSLNSASFCLYRSSFFLFLAPLGFRFAAFVWTIGGIIALLRTEVGSCMDLVGTFSRDKLDLALCEIQKLTL